MFDQLHLRQSARWQIFGDHLLLNRTQQTDTPQHLSKWSSLPLGLYFSLSQSKSYLTFIFTASILGIVNSVFALQITLFVISIIALIQYDYCSSIINYSFITYSVTPICKILISIFVQRSLLRSR